MNSEQDRPWHPAGETKFCIRLGVDYNDHHEFRRKHGTQFFWSRDKKSWYWISDEELPNELKPFVTPTKYVAGGLERLCLELVPFTCWYSNVRSHVSEHAWGTITETIAHEADHRCEICGEPVNHWLRDCHEVFYYNDWTNTQKLVGFQTLCKTCHMVKHFGLAKHMGKEKQALEHLAAINGWSVAQANQYAEQMIWICKQRSIWLWDLDLSYLKKKFEFSVRAESAEERAINAEREQQRRQDSLGIDSSSVLVMREAPAPTEQQELDSASQRWSEDLLGK